jgi:predicted DNA-binding transcriptional regulator AlpA
MDKTHNRLLRQCDVAEIIGMSEAWLEQCRFQGRGIPYIKLGRSVRYFEDDIQAWLEMNKVSITDNK